MKLKDVFTKLVENKKSGQLNTSIKKRGLKQAGISEKDLFDLKIDSKLKRLLND